MEAIIPWITAHWSDILAAWGAIVAAASVIVKLTPTQADDHILEKVVKAVEWLSIFNRKG